MGSVECFDLKSFLDVVFQYPFDKMECPICQKQFDFTVLRDQSKALPHFIVHYSTKAKSTSITWPFAPNNKTTADAINDMITRRFNYDIAMKAILDETTADARKIEVSWIKDTLQYKEINYKNNLNKTVNKSNGLTSLVSCCFW